MHRWILLAIPLCCSCSAPSGTDGGPDGSVDGGPDGSVDAGCDPSSSASLMSCVEVARYRADLETVTGARNPGHPHWQQVQDLCAQRLASLGFTVERHAYASGVNVVGVLPGGDLAAQQVVVSAHYDSLASCPSADDNASGVAGALEAARVLAHGRYRRTLVVACWDEEESGLRGSDAWATRARARGDTISVALVLEMIGYKNADAGTQTLPAGLELFFPAPVAAVHANQDRGDFIVLIGDDQAHPSIARFEARAQSLALKTVVFEVTAAQKVSPALADLRRSDHAAFWEQNYPAFMLGDTANFRNPHYHCSGGADVIADLDHGFAAQVVGATVGTAVDALELR